MKSTGIVRRIDQLGRIVIPKETRKALKLGEGEPAEIFVDGDTVVLRKYQIGCAFCGSVDNYEGLTNFKGKLICKTCMENIRGL